MRAVGSLLGFSRTLRSPLGLPLKFQQKFEQSPIKRGQWRTGHTIIALFATPFLYSALKSAYMTVRMRRLETQEILSDRFTWLHERMLEDEVEALLIQQVANSNVDRTQPLLRLGPSYVRSV
ncbi:hypothetical protein, conserved [Eimeria necatrix]|uniref:Uncharacterized protein n=1 Tax=Eimeria necatrix TaxID=51315 RepID=U6MWE6_9EIME|nr:hypothetical protein, conserved [Eimeria necatrix]CDJ66824.1 hypothetical protein, conserved [Eimeria necatrix]